MPTIQRFPCKGMSIREIVESITSVHHVEVSNISVYGDFASVYFVTHDLNWDKYFTDAIDEIPLIKECMRGFHGWSSGEISVETGFNRGAIKRSMQELEKEGLGEYIMFGGMYYFFFHNPQEG